MRYEEIKNYAYQMLDKKIDIEVKFIYSFLEIMRLLFLQFILDSKSELTDGQKESILKWMGKTYSVDSRAARKEELTDSLRDGYTEGNEEKIIKEKYIELFNDECIFEQLIVEGCIASLNNNSDIIEGLQTTYNEAVNNGLDGKDGTMKYIDNVLSNNPTFLAIAKSKIAAMYHKHYTNKMSYTKAQSSYLKEIMFDAWMEREQKLRKNDIFDMLLVGVLDYKEPQNSDNLLTNNAVYLISFDKTMRRFICGHSTPSEKFIARYDI